MNVADLIEELKALDPDTELAIAYQPSWAMTEKVSGLAESNKVLYFAGTGSNDYLPTEVAEQLEW